MYYRGLNRSGWADKSQAALEMEREAKRIFEAFHQRCSEMDLTTTATTFPCTEEILRPQIHLTGACYTTFRKYVMEKGCRVKRREITSAEAGALPKGATRRGKMYAISVTVPVHPGQMAETEARKAQAATERQEAQMAAALRKKQREEEIKIKSAAQFASIKDGTHPVVSPDGDKKRPLVALSPQDKENAGSNADANAALVPAAKKPKNKTTACGGPFGGIPPQAILERLGEDFQERLQAVRTQIARERDDFNTSLNQKQQQMELQVKTDCECLQSIILHASSSSTTTKQ